MFFISCIFCSLTKDTFHGLTRLETLEILNMGRLDRFDSDVLSYLINLRSLAVETYPNIEKYRFRLGKVILDINIKICFHYICSHFFRLSITKINLQYYTAGAVLSGIAHLEELKVQIREPILSDQLLGGILPKLRKLTIVGPALKKMEPSAFEGLQNCFHMDLTITHTQVDDIPSRVFELLYHAEWARLDISNNRMASLDSSALYPNRSVWFSKGTKLLQGGLVLNGNEWICDCDLVWIGEWLRRWLRESFESHSTAIPLVHSMYEEIRTPTCMDIKGGGRIIPLIELYSDVMCHASALSKGTSLHNIRLLSPLVSFDRSLPSGFIKIDNLLWICGLFLVTLSSIFLPALLFNSACAHSTVTSLPGGSPSAAFAETKNKSRLKSGYEYDRCITNSPKSENLVGS